MANKVMNPVNISRLTANYGDGKAAAADITITGIKLGDHLVTALHVSALGAAGKAFLGNLTDECTITADDTVQCSTTDTSTANEQLLVFWVPASDAP